jgi:phospholipase/carboxylesterase
MNQDRTDELTALSDMPTQGSPAVLFLHGRGANEESAALFGEVFPGVSVIAPRGPLREGAGYAWFRNHSPGIADERSLAEQIPLLESWIDADTIPQQSIWLCGYSNGAAMAASLLLSRPHRYRGAMLLSGPLVANRPWPAGRLTDIPVLFSWGDQDRLIPTQLMADSAEYLRGPSGAIASIARTSGGHEMSMHTLETTRTWFAHHARMGVLQPPGALSHSECR